MAEKEVKLSKEKRELWIRWDDTVNMTASEVRTFRTSEEGRAVGWDPSDARDESINGTAGHDAAKIIERMISKAGTHRGKKNSPPAWTIDEWRMAQKQIAYIARARSNIGPLKDEEDEPTPKAKAMKLWGRDEIRAAGKKFMTKEDAKKELVNDSYELVNQLLDYL